MRRHKNIDPPLGENLTHAMRLSPVAPGSYETVAWNALRSVFEGTERKYLPENETDEEVVISETPNQPEEFTQLQS